MEPRGRGRLIAACMTVNKLVQDIEGIEYKLTKAWFKKTKARLENELASKSIHLDDAVYQLVKVIRS